MTPPLFSVLDALTPHAIEQAIPLAHKYDSVNLIRHSPVIRGLSPSLADEKVPVYSGYIHFRILSSESIMRNLAERIVVAIRIRDARK